MDDYPSDCSSMYDNVTPDREELEPDYVDGVVERYIVLAREQGHKTKGGISCPCAKCIYRKKISASDVKAHLCRFGFCSDDDSEKMDHYPSDSSSMYDNVTPEREELEPDYIDGVVEEYIVRARERGLKTKGGISCPCTKCMFKKKISASDVKAHLCRFGFCFDENGEVMPRMPSAPKPTLSSASTSIGETPQYTPLTGSTPAPLPLTDNGGDHDMATGLQQIPQPHVDCDSLPGERPFIQPSGRGFLPCRIASKAIRRVIQSELREPYSKWGEIPDDVVDKWFEKFGSYVAWLPEHEYQIKQNFMSKGSKRLTDILMDAREKQKRPYWLGEEAWNGLQKYWDSPAFKKVSDQAKKNRSSAKGGFAHTCGSISMAEHAMRLKRELGREVTIDELFLATHTKKGENSSWVDSRAKETYDTFQKKLRQATRQADASGRGSKGVDPATRQNLWVESAGGKRRGHVYGTGDLFSRHRPGVASLAQKSPADMSSTPKSGDLNMPVVASLPEKSPADMGSTPRSSQHSEEVTNLLQKLEQRTKEAEERAARAEEQARQDREAFMQQIERLTSSVAAIHERVQSPNRPRRRQRRH